MATTTGILPPISPRNMMGSCGFYGCRSPKPLPTSWPYRRHSFSISHFDSPVLVGDSFETNSLPATPLPFVSLGESRRMNSFWEETDCNKDAGSLFSSSVSSGYCSESSEGSTSDSSFYFPFSSKDLVQNDSDPKDQQTIPILFEDPSNQTLVTGKNNQPNDSQSSPSPSLSDSESSEPLRASPFSDISSSPSASLERSVSENDASPNLTSVLVASKRSSSESSSSSSGLTSSDDAPRRRVKDDEGFIRRASCVCVNEDESKVVLISSKNEGGGWLIPGGGLESGEGEAEAAVREAWEEAGITGCVKRCLGVFQSEDEATHKKKRTAVYVLTVREQHSVFPEVRLGRVREWFPIDSAVFHLSQCKPHQIAYLRAL